MIKYFRLTGLTNGSGGTWEYILWGISWANLLMLSASTPTYEKDKDGEENNDNLKELDEREIENFFSKNIM